MFCTKCGVESNKSDSFCSGCGNKFKKESLSNFSKSDNGNPQKNKIVKLDKTKQTEQLSSLKQTYNITGVLSVSLGLFSVISGVVIGFSPADLTTDVLVSLAMNAPRLYFRYKMFINKANDLESGLKTSKGMMIFLLIVAVSNLIFGNGGWLYYILIYFYYKSYKETKKLLSF